MATTKKAPVRRKKAATTNAPLTKEALAKQKVEELLDGVKLTKADKEVVVDRLEEATKGKDVDWLEGQVKGLTEQNKKLTDDYAKLLNDYQQLKQGTPATTTDEATKKGVEKIFLELDAVVTGQKFGKPYEDAKIRPLLNKFMATFPFLGETLRRKNVTAHVPRSH